MTGGAFTHGPITVKAKVHDLLTGIETDDGPDMLLDKFGRGAERASQFLVLTVTLEGSQTLVDNAKMLRQGRWLKTLDDATWVLRKEAQVAVMFIGPSNTLALTWEKHKGDDVRGGGLLMDAGITMFAILGWGLSEPSGPGRDRTERLDKAPGFFHFYLSPIYIWFLLVSNLKNLELYTTDIPLTPDLTLKLTGALQDVYKTYSGRCELRFTGSRTYVDLFFWSNAGARAVLHVLSAFGVKKCALHPGKYQLNRGWFACENIELVTPYDVK